MDPLASDGGTQITPKKRKIRKSGHALPGGSAWSRDKERRQVSTDVEHVLGMTVYSNSALTCDPASGLVAYPAGSVLVLLDTIKYKQVGTLHTPRKAITAVEFSPDGRYMLTGESGLNPAVRVWDLANSTEVATLRGHCVGITCVSFSPRMREIIVIGETQDMMISVWGWPSAVMRGLNKFAGQIMAMAVSEDSRFFVTVGNRHVKFFYTENLSVESSSRSEIPSPVPLPNRCGILDNLKENCFCDVICGHGRSRMYIFVISMAGILCQVNRNRLLERWVHVNTTAACCLTADEDHVFVGCSGGVIRVFRTCDLQFVTTLPLPHSLGLDIAQVTQTNAEDMDQTYYNRGSKYPATRALAYDSVHRVLTAVYSDHSIYVWGRQDKTDSEDIERFVKNHSSMYHRSSVWDLSTYPLTKDVCYEEALGGALPPGALISVSSDGTLRAWDVSSKISEDSVLKRNCVSAECLKIVYTERRDSPRKSRLRPNASGTPHHRGKQCFSVLTVCPDGQHIATGNRQGTLCIYDTNTMKVEVSILAHVAEVTALGYAVSSKYKILASGSRDRMIHIMDAARGYQLLTTLDDHSSTITAIHFTHMASCLLMITSSLDMSVLIRVYLETNFFSFKPVRAIVEKKSVLDFTIHPFSGLMALACQDRMVRVYSIMNAVQSKSFIGCPSYGGQLIKIQADPSGQFLLTACSNKTINLLQFNTGGLLTTLNGHSENITCVRFAFNMKHIISAAVDGCIYLWKLPQMVEYTVKKEMAEMGRLTRGMVLGDRWKKSRQSKNEMECKDPKIVFPRELGSNFLPKLELQPTPLVLNALTSVEQKSTEKQLFAVEHAGELNYKPLLMSRLDTECQTSGAWLSSCYERRRIFKLEARSIKKMLTMMRLVTDAMEKDLAEGGGIVGPNTASALPDEATNPNTAEITGVSEKTTSPNEESAGMNSFELVMTTPSRKEEEQKVWSEEMKWCSRYSNTQTPIPKGGQLSGFLEVPGLPNKQMLQLRGQQQRQPASPSVPNIRELFRQHQGLDFFRESGGVLKTSTHHQLEQCQSRSVTCCEVSPRCHLVIQQGKSIRASSPQQIWTRVGGIEKKKAKHIRWEQHTQVEGEISCSVTRSGEDDERAGNGQDMNYNKIEADEEKSSSSGEVVVTNRRCSGEGNVGDGSDKDGGTGFLGTDGGFSFTKVGDVVRDVDIRVFITKDNTEGSSSSVGGISGGSGSIGSGGRADVRDNGTAGCTDDAGVNRAVGAFCCKNGNCEASSADVRGAVGSSGGKGDWDSVCGGDGKGGGNLGGESGDSRNFVDHAGDGSNDVEAVSLGFFGTEYVVGSSASVSAALKLLLQESVVHHGEIRIKKRCRTFRTSEEIPRL